MDLSEVRKFEVGVGEAETYMHGFRATNVTARWAYSLTDLRSFIIAIPGMRTGMGDGDVHDAGRSRGRV